ncbi:hypothetical protein A0H81_07794 [Grifola frondosa]|uniref:PRMT5 oligomerisation domain-containing protein n=1 Tax=Grifola frondosa TaxID=5627 RepID=A0A1C7M6S2_GRIFR|nr:hypothetical protein A0H81_07794 [Grifola frondosa]
MHRVSKDMLSWFPIFFPFKDPLYLPSDAELEVSMWRLTDQRKVWYEWYAEAFLPVPSASIRRPNWRDSLSPISASDSTVLLPPSTPIMVSSPLLDVPPLSLSGNTLIKIGQTALHNPGGRSSWIGL